MGRLMPASERVKYPEKCRKNLLANSLEKEDYEIALNEWYFYHEVIDNNEFAEVNTAKHHIKNGMNT